MADGAITRDTTRFITGITPQAIIRVITVTTRVTTDGTIAESRNLQRSVEAFYSRRVHILEYKGS